MIRIPSSGKVDGLGRRRLVPQASWFLQAAQPTAIQITPNWSLQVPAGAFADSSGKVVERPVQVSFMVLDSLADMFAQGHPTQHARGLVDCRAQFCLKARRGAQQLQLIKPLTVRWEGSLSLAENTAFQILQAGPDTLRPLHSQSAVIWKNSHQSKLNIQRADNKSQIHFQLPSCGWWALGELRLSTRHSGLFSVKVKAQGEKLSFLRAVLFYEQMNTFVELYPAARGFSSINLPVDRSADLFVFGRNKGRWWSAGRQIQLPWPTQLELRPQPVRELPLVLSFLR